MPISTTTRSSSVQPCYISKPRRCFLYCLYFLSFTIGVNSAQACAWDYDTLAMERQTFPGVLELITGKFLRHSTAFYEWRIKDRLTRLENEPDALHLYDDLGVAYDKTGQHDKAIDVMLEKEKIKPGLYETHANLGTFYIHGGQLAKGLLHIEKAIEINPDAHFGREIYQALLVKYVQSKTVDQSLSQPMEKRQGYGMGFPHFVLQAQFPDPAELDHDAKQAEYKRALKGVLGMMRFGNYDSPILLEVLGELLLVYQGDDNQRYGDGKRLAARAYLKASYHYQEKSSDTSKRYRDLAISILDMQVTTSQGKDNSIIEIEQRFKEELAEAQTWHQQIAADEKAWIDAGTDVDAAFSKKYYKAPEVTWRDEPSLTTPEERINNTLAIFIMTIIAIISLSLVISNKRKEARKIASLTSESTDA